eukprot:gene9636-biopygen12244
MLCGESLSRAKVPHHIKRPPPPGSRAAWSAGGGSQLVPAPSCRTAPRGVRHWDASAGASLSPFGRTPLGAGAGSVGGWMGGWVARRAGGGGREFRDSRGASRCANPRLAPRVRSRPTRVPGARRGRMGPEAGPAFQRWSRGPLPFLASGWRKLRLVCRIKKRNSQCQHSGREFTYKIAVLHFYNWKFAGQTAGDLLLPRRDPNRRTQIIRMASGNSLAFQRLSRDPLPFILSVRLVSRDLNFEN